jgi:uncharacterized RDD family membrane protein YckC
VAIQGRHAGLVSRSLAFIIDRIIQTGLYALFLLLVVTTFHVLFDNVVNDDSHIIIVHGKNYTSIILAIGYFWFNVLYDTISVAFVGRTIGKSIFGLLIVTATGKPITILQALFRSILLAPVPLVVVSGWLAICRSDRRTIHDVVGCTSVIYNWDARSFQIREACVTDAQRAQDPMLHDFYVI